MSTAAIVGGVTAAAGLGSAAISSNAAQNAASEQSQAAEQAAQLQYQASQNALGFQEGQWNTEQNDLAPWLNSGTGALSNLDYLMGVTPQAPAGSSTTAIPTASATTSGGTGLSGPAMGGQTQALSPGLQSPVSGVQTQPLTAAIGAPAAQPISGMTQPLSGARSTSVALPGAQAPTTGTPAPTSGTPPMSSTPVTAAPSSSAGGYGSLLAPYSGTFTAPTAQQALNSPGEQAQLQLGQQAMEQSAAARGGLLTGGELQAENQLAQQYASTNYQNVYNDAYNTYAAGYNQYENQQSNEFNRLSALAGGGQTAANTLGTLGQSASNNVSSNLLGTASAMGQDTQNAAAANASGIVGSANAYAGALGSSTSNLTQLALLQQLLGGSSGASAVSNQNELTGAGF